MNQHTNDDHSNLLALPRTAGDLRASSSGQTNCLKNDGPELPEDDDMEGMDPATIRAIEERQAQEAREYPNRQVLSVYKAGQRVCRITVDLD